MHLRERVQRASGRVQLTGLEALVRALFEQVGRDRAAGLRAAGLCSGYPGSPLAGLDQLFDALSPELAEADIHFVPGLNEELAASIVAGTQFLPLFPHERYDSVVGMWYGKAPGLDRALDALRHANFMGTPRTGGALAVVGDDPFCKSSSLPSHSEHALAHAFVPTLFPSDTGDVLELARHAYALSRYAGLWVGLKLVADVADGGGILELARPADPRLPALEIGGRPFEPHFDPRLLPPHVNRIEEEILFGRLAAATAYARANGLDPMPARHSGDRIGLVAAGALYRELEAALASLGIDEPACERLGLRLLHVRLVYPLDEERVREFALGLEQIVVVDTRRGFLEDGIRRALFLASERPRLVGTRDADGAPWLSRRSEVTSSTLAADLGPWLAAATGEAALRVPGPTHSSSAGLSIARAPRFCSGCPHSNSTRLPEDAIAGGGIGCHTMALLMDRDVRFIGAMGSEGAHWTGVERFVDTPHLFQNLGDGTYHHSGRLAIRQAVEANATVTYKLLYNGFIAMTGGQTAPGEKPLAGIVRDLLSDGVRRVVAMSNDPALRALAHGDWRVQCIVRAEYENAMRELQHEPGVTVLIYDEVCANQQQRLERRGVLAPALEVVMIDEDVCEGCGDCIEKSTCVSLRPVETPVGRKTRIHETSCSDDRACVEGDCPAFVSIARDALADARRREAEAALAVALPELPEPHTRPIPTTGSVDLLLVGIGSTGVVTANALLVDAARQAGLFASHLDQTGLAQRGGKVVSHCRIGREAPRGSARVGVAGADVLLAFDPIGATDAGTRPLLDPGRTLAVASDTLDLPESLASPGVPLPSFASFEAELRTRVKSLVCVAAEELAEIALGDTRAANVIVLGAALQLGLLPVPREALEAAIEARGVGAKGNRRALELGRAAVHDPGWASRLRAPARPPAIGDGAEPELAAARLGSAWDGLSHALDELEAGPCVEGLRRRVAGFALDLADFQSHGYAVDYLASLAALALAEAAAAPGSSELSATAARELYRLMAYKDEYEVARLLLRGPWRRWLDARGVPRAAIRYHLHPPLLRALGLERKIALPARFADPLLRALAAARRIRGSRLDPFARLPSRRAERELVRWYRAALESVARLLQPETLADALEIAAAPGAIRGFEGRKAAREAEARAFVAERLAKIGASRGETPKLSP